MNKEREIAGIKVFVSNETYNEYKGTLQDQINELQNRIDKALEYINKYCEDYVVEDSPDPMCLFYGDDGTYKPEAKQELLEILQCKEK